MSDDETPRKPRDWSHIEIPSIPADDPIFREGVIITFPIRSRRAVETESIREAPSDGSKTA